MLGNIGSSRTMPKKILEMYLVRPGGCLIKTCTQKLDDKILKMLRDGFHPKEILFKLKLPGPWSITNAKWRGLRDRKRKERGTEDRRSSVNKYGQYRIPSHLYDRWIKILSLDPLSFERAGGCYVFYENGKPFYVGQSSNVRNRISNHGVRKSSDDSVFYTPWGDKKSIFVKVKYHLRFGKWLTSEARLIKRLKTKENDRGYKSFSH